jgi:hypothetical protein
MRQRARAAYLHGRAADAAPGDEHSPAAEALLSRAVKLDASLLAAWNSLGECFMQQQVARRALSLSLPAARARTLVARGC